MKSRASSDFWKAFNALPQKVQQAAREKYRLWLADPQHGSLQFKELSNGLYSVRVNLQYRALGIRNEDEIIWIWIGAHGEYDRRIR